MFPPQQAINFYYILPRLVLNIIKVQKLIARFFIAILELSMIWFKLKWNGSQFNNLCYLQTFFL